MSVFKRMMAIVLLTAMAAGGAASPGSVPESSGGAIMIGIVAAQMADCENCGTRDTTDVCDVQCVVAPAALPHVESSMVRRIDGNVTSAVKTAFKATTSPPELHPPRLS